MKLNKFSMEVHQNAVEHGWWDEDRTFGDIIALCHSELSEALEEYRARRPMIWHLCKKGWPCDGELCDEWIEGECQIKYLESKPEGIAVELADCVIRILDWLGKEGINADALIVDPLDFCDLPAPAYGGFGTFIARLHCILSSAFSCWYNGNGTTAVAMRLVFCINEIENWTKEHSVDLEAVMEQKHAYNKTRPYRHGGKAL